MKQLITLGLILGSLLFSSFSMAEKVLLLADNHMSKGKMELIKGLAADKGIEFSYQKFSRLKKEEAAAKFAGFDLVMFDALNPRIAKMVFAKFSPAIKANAAVKFEPVRMPPGSPYRQGVSDEQASAIKNYYHNGGRHNFENLMAYLSREVFGHQQYSYEAFKPLPDNGFYHPQLPDLVAAQKSDLAGIIDFNANKPTVLVSMHRSAVEGEQTDIINGILAALEQRGAQAVGYFFDGSSDDLPDGSKVSKFLKLLQKDAVAGQVNNNQTWADVIVNTRMIHYMSKRATEFKTLNVPVINVQNYYDGDQADYEEDHAGLSATMAPYFLMMPETAGVVDPTILTAKNSETEAQEIIDYQLDGLAERALHQAKLSRKVNKDKKVAIMIWNYPPGEKNVGAAFLNVPRSLDQITNELIANGFVAEQKNEDYFINNAGGLLKPLYRTGFKDSIEEMGLAGYLPLSEYYAWFNLLPKAVQDDINNNWGKIEDHPFVEEKDGELQMMVARMKNGNVITLPQPSNGTSDEEHSRLYHGGSSVSSHYYFAVYLYVKKTFGADAIIHLGTHGSQEWLKGKERGLSVYDSPSLAVGNLPVIYPFIMDNVGEAMQAKRRGRATMISHMTPGFAAAGLHSDIKHMEELLHRYDLLDEGETKSRTAQSILDKVEEMDIAAELSFSDEMSFEEKKDLVHEYMHDLAVEAQPLGLHTFGRLAKDSHLITTIQQMISPQARDDAMRYERQNDLTGMLEKLKPEDNVITQEYSEKMAENNVVQLTDVPGFKVLWLAIIEGQEFDVSDELQQAIKEGKKYYADFQAQGENEALIATLHAEFRDVAPGGDPIRNPAALPTGRNLIGFNPAKVPSKEAYETGKALVEDTINKYYDKHGQYPDKLAFSLWSLETMRHHGVLESQIMAAMGVKPVWDRRDMVVGTEIIEYKDLKRPRVDVAISATGLYRDAFPNVMLLLAAAIDDVAQMKEENNSIYKNTQALKSQLLESGVEEKDAEYLSSVRIFSNETGAYGTGLAGASLASGTWETDAKLSDLYIERMGYIFGRDENRWSEKPDPSTVGSLYSKVLSGTDAVVFSRSSNLYGVITNDDPFQYFGGIALAVRNIDGASPEMYISNLRKPNQTKNETLQKFMGRELRTRAFHPRWIKEMQNEGYAGAATVLDRVNNFWGWTVMDPNSTNNTQWQEFVEVYVNDKYDMEMKQFFEHNNPHVLAQIIERILEAERKDYFETDEETLKKLTETYLELANKYDVFTDNEKFEENVENMANGFGLNFELPLKESTEFTNTVPDSAANQERIEGQQLEKQEAVEQEKDYDVLYFVFGILAIFLAGFAAQFRQREDDLAAA